MTTTEQLLDIKKEIGEANTARERQYGEVQGELVALTTTLKDFVSVVRDDRERSQRVHDDCQSEMQVALADHDGRIKCLEDDKKLHEGARQQRVKIAGWLKWAIATAISLGLGGFLFGLIESLTK